MTPFYSLAVTQQLECYFPSLRGGVARGATLTPYPSIEQKDLEAGPFPLPCKQVLVALMKGCDSWSLQLPAPRGGLLELCLCCMGPFVLLKYFIVMTSTVWVAPALPPTLHVTCEVIASQLCCPRDETPFFICFIH